MTKLLNKPLKAFTLYASIILIISIPIYAYVIDFIWTSELDESNWLALQHTKHNLTTKNVTASELENIDAILGSVQPGISIKKAQFDVAFEDSVYEVVRPNIFDEEDEEDRFRGLKSFV